MTMSKEMERLKSIIRFNKEFIDFNSNLKEYKIKDGGIENGR